MGGASDSESDGTPLDMTIFSEKEDLRVVMRYVQTLEYVDASRLVLIGCSQGGLVSGLIAVDVPEEVNRLILMYPALCIPDDARDGNMLMFHFDPTQIPDVIESEEFSLRGDYAKQVLDMDAINIISNYPGKVLVICGKEDLIVDYSYMTRIMTVFSAKRGYGAFDFEQQTHPDLQFFPIEQAKHGFTEAEHAMVISQINHFMNK